MGDTGNFGILLGDTLGCIDQKNDDICALYGRYCTDDAVPLQLLFDLVFLSKTCGIDENIFISIVHDRGIDRIARRSGDVGYDDTVRAQQFVDQGGFSDVRFSNNGDARNLALLLVFHLRFKVSCHLIEHIADAELSGCGNGVRLSDAEVIEFINIHHLTVEVVDFVDHQHNRLAASSEHISYFCIGIYKALTDVSDEDDDICGINGDLRLVSHLGENDIFGFRLNTAGVYQRKFVVQPLHVGINTVTGYTRCVFYNRNIVSG